ncbi:MAG TPA: carboxypeptidase-like regulatory domain-containing protein [Bryobacteraceae bacterium]|nr:carboxypeptidase-like regulatory domain-containing protein [Bryobacteraceae bacterium]
MPQPAGITLSGAITDASRAAVPNAKISVKNVATGQVTETQTSPAGTYSIANLTPGEYEISVAADGFDTKVAKVRLAEAGQQALDLALTAAAGTAAPSLADLGFTPAQAQGSAQEQARLDKRSHMLKVHQRLGLITAAPLVATLITSSGAGGRNSSASGRELHAALGATTAGLYLTTASFAIFAPKVPSVKTRGPIRLHKALAWIHGPGMIITPILGGLAFEQRSNGQKVHGIAQAHAAAAWVTATAYGLAILSVSIKF